MLVKNCGLRMYSLVLEKDFLHQLYKFCIDPKSDEGVVASACDLLQSWKAGLKKDTGLQELDDTIIKLKNEGLPFFIWALC